MSAQYYIPTVNLMGEGSLSSVPAQLRKLNCKKALIVTDRPLVEAGIVKFVTDMLSRSEIPFAIFDEVQPNPTNSNVEAGLKVLTNESCDVIIAVGGGSPMDCAKGIGLVATNGGDIRDYEGVDLSKNKMTPMIAVNTTAGTASEMTRFTIITDVERHIKMAIVDQNVTPVVSVNDPKLMTSMPKSLTAATGMDALTHAVEAYVSTAATPVTDSAAIMAIEMIGEWLPKAVANGNDMIAREKMAYAQFMAGMAFNNASLGYVHAMAHQLGGMYDLPHGVCNAILLPHVSEFNILAKAERFAKIAAALGENVEGLPVVEAAHVAISAIKKLAANLDIPAGLREIGVKKEDFEVLAKNAMKDACMLTNPRVASLEEVIKIYDNAF
jgi:alcohol dehydrogenase